MTERDRLLIDAIRACRSALSTRNDELDTFVEEDLARLDVDFALTAVRALQAMLVRSCEHCGATGGHVPGCAHFARRSS